MMQLIQVQFLRLPNLASMSSLYSRIVICYTANFLKPQPLDPGGRLASATASIRDYVGRLPSVTYLGQNRGE